jgi:hypothetical protein
VSLAAAAYVTTEQRRQLDALPEWHLPASLLDETPADWGVAAPSQQQQARVELVRDALEKAQRRSLTHRLPPTAA